MIGYTDELANHYRIRSLEHDRRYYRTMARVALLSATLESILIAVAVMT